MPGVGDFDPSEYVQLQEEYEEQLDDFMRKFLRRKWPVCLVVILGIFQLMVSLTLLAIDLPIILMFAPRWEVFVALWGFLFTFLASISTLHSTRKVTWLKLKWAAAFNIIGGIVAALVIAFNILILANSKVCVGNNGCHYLSYTYAAAKSYYGGETAMGILFFFSVGVFLFIFIKFGIGGLTLFEHIQNGWMPANFNSIVSSTDGESMTQMATHPMVGPGATAGKPSTPPVSMQPGGMIRGPQPPHSGGVPQYPPPPPGAMMRYPPPPPGAIMRYPPPPPGTMMRYPPPPPGAMMGYPRPPGAMIQGPRGPMMVSRPMSPMQVGNRQPGPYPPAGRPQ